MGASLAKELGLFNEEEIILPIVSENETPTRPRYRSLGCDPRSATIGIIRTPILVDCTPVPKMPTSKLTLSNTSLNETTDVTNEEVIKVEPKVKQYLETDIDAVEHSEYSPQTDMPLPVLKHPRVITLSQDPRSPASFEVTRSPIQVVECSPGMFSLCSKIDSANFDFSNCESDDPSAIVSEIGESPIVKNTKQPEEFKDWFENLTKKMNGLTATEGFSPKNSPSAFADRNLMKKQLFLTPPNVKTPQKQKPRTPLGTVHQNSIVPSPKSIQRAKQWQNIEDERSRRGIILDNENTPPPLPPLSHISSAPGKLVRKRNIDWDCDSTIFI